MPGRGLAEPTYTQSVASFPSLLAYHALLNTLCSVARSYPTLCNPMDCSPPGSSIRGILQARRLEWVSRSSSRLSSQPRSWTWVPRCLLALTDRFFTTEILYLGNLTRYNPFLQIAPLAPRWWTKYIPSNTISSLGLCISPVCSPVVHSQRQYLSPGGTCNGWLQHFLIHLCNPLCFACSYFQGFSSNEMVPFPTQSSFNLKLDWL